ncbi:hypothetical protein [Actibacterium sp. D379-3]
MKEFLALTGFFLLMICNSAQAQYAANCAPRDRGLAHLTNGYDTTGWPVGPSRGIAAGGFVAGTGTPTVTIPCPAA